MLSCVCLKISVGHAQNINQCIEKHILTHSLHLPVDLQMLVQFLILPEGAKGGRGGCKVLVFGGTEGRTGKLRSQAT